MSTIALNNFSLRQSKQGLKLEEDFDEEMKDQEAGGDDLQTIFDMVDGYNESKTTDGFIEYEEMTGFLDMLVAADEMSQTERDIIVEEAGKICGDDDKLDFDEFVFLVEILEAKQYEDYEEDKNGGRQGVWEYIDANQDNQLDEQEIADVLTAEHAAGHMDEETAHFL